MLSRTKAAKFVLENGSKIANLICQEDRLRTQTLLNTIDNQKRELLNLKNQLSLSERVRSGLEDDLMNAVTQFYSLCNKS